MIDKFPTEESSNQESKQMNQIEEYENLLSRLIDIKKTINLLEKKIASQQI